MSRQLQTFATQNQLNRPFRQCGEEIRNVIRQVLEKRPHMQNTPIGMVAVFGPDDPPNKTVLTDWLIHYFEYSSRVENKTEIIDSENQLEFLDGWQDLDDDLYFWPELYHVVNHQGSEPLVCFVLFIKGDSCRLYEMAMSACSQAFILKTNSKDKFKNIMETIYFNGLRKSCKLIELPEKFNQLNLPTGDEFLEFLDSHPLNCKTDRDGNAVLLSNLQAFIDDIGSQSKMKTAVNINLIEGSKTQNLYTNTILNLKEKQNLGSTPQNNSGSSSSIFYTGLSKLVGYPEAIKGNHFPEVHQESQKICIKMSCHSFYRSVIPSTQKWLERQSCPWTLPQAHELLQSFKLHDDHENICELEQTFYLIDMFASDLRNMFDNYVCFHGEDDYNQFTQFTDKAWKRVSAEFSLRKFLHSTSLEKIFTDACGKLQALYTVDNTKIVENEKHLATIIKTSALEEFRLLVNNHLKSKNSSDNFLKALEHHQKSYVLMMTRCLDHGDKLNHVQTEASKELLNEMNAEFQKTKLFLRERTLEKYNKLLYAAYRYHKETTAKNMYTLPSNFTEQEIYKHHNYIDSMIVDKVESVEDKRDIRGILYGHFIHIISKRWEQMQASNVEKIRPTCKALLNTICIYLVPDGIHLDYMTSKEHLHVIYNKDDRLSWAPGIIALNSKGDLKYGFDAEKIIEQNPGKTLHQGRIDSYIRNMTAYDSYTKKMLCSLFHELKLTSQNCFQKEFKRALVLVPSWYAEEHLQVVRLAAEEAGFFEVFLTGESSVISFKLLETTKRKYDLAVSVSVTPNGILVEIFGNGDEHGKIRMLGKAFSGWNSKSDGVSLQGSANSEDCINRDNQVHWAYTKALSQVEPIRQKDRNYCFLLGDLPNRQMLFDNYFQKQGNIVIVTDPRDKYGVKGSASLSLDPKTMRDKIIDYLYVDIMASSWEKTSCKNTASGSSESNNQKDRKPITLPKPDTFQVKKENLFRLCESIRDQIKSGDVKVMRSFLKSINETLCRAEEVASNKYASSFEVEREESEINELLTEYGFRRKDTEAK